MKPLSALALAIGLVVGLAGCERQPPQPANSTAPPAQGSAPSVTSTPVESRIDAPIDPSQIATRIELLESPMHLRSSDRVLVRVRVHNEGSHLLVSSGEKMVRLGAMLVGPAGIDTAPGNRDFVRADLPLVQPGSSAEVDLELPVAPLLGLPVRIELVQEGVNWFGQYGQRSLDLGPFMRCTDEPMALCDAAGAAVASR